MVRNLKQIEGRALLASDGTVGEVKDVDFDDHHWHVRYLVVQKSCNYVLFSHFDDHHWHVRYLVVKTGAWLKKRNDPATPWNSVYAAELHDHYGRPRYSDWDKDITAGAPKLDRKQ